MVKRVLAWIRHGEYAQPPGVPSAHLPHGLTARGREQSRAAAQAIWQYALDHRLTLDPVIDCSRMRRAWETASLLGEELLRIGGPALLVEEFGELAERCLGASANLTVDEIESVLAADPRFASPAPGWKRDPHYTLPLQGAESLAQAGERVARHVLRRTPATGDSPSLKLFVGHGGAFRHAAGWLGLLSFDDLQSLSMHHAVPIYFEHRPAPSQAPGASGDRLVTVAGEWRQRTDATPLD
jgi:2,3-bisphosphoglycerate-dependent phosphoglycerate mutase